MPHKLVLATRNQGKITEFRRILDELAPGQINLIGVDQFPDLVDVDEIGSTFEENSLLKSRYTCLATGLPAIADDSGLCVDFLNGDPGIFSARWAGIHGNDQANIEKLLAQLRDVPDSNRTAHFKCVASLVLPDGRVQVAEGRFEGHILHAPVGYFLRTNERTGKGFGQSPRKITAFDRTPCHPNACEPGVTFAYTSA
jgi:XTP/dITP diphosphohydrolase